ncbi:transcriptional regulator GcvA [Denitratisoma sp. agr-D3]
MFEKLPSLRALRAFEAAARHLSFAKAAEELHVTPAAISQQIKLLEEQLQHPLFLRAPTLALTERALAALPLIRNAFQTLDQAAGLIRCGEARPLVLSTPPSFASRWLIPRLEGFQAKHPDIELRLLASTRLVDFDREDVDLAVRYGSGRYPGLHVERLRSETVVAVVHPRLAANLHRPEDLLNVTLLHNTAMGWDPSFPDWNAWLKSAGVALAGPVKVREFGDANLVIEAALAGLGAALVWRTLVSEELASGRLLAPFADSPLESSYHLVCPPDRVERPRIAAFRQWLLAEAEKD